MNKLKLARAFIQAQGGVTGGPHTIILKQAARLVKLEAFVQKFLDNFEECEHCNGTGVFSDDGFDCLICYGKGKHLKSVGILYVELPEDARQLLKQETGS